MGRAGMATLAAALGAEVVYNPRSASGSSQRRRGGHTAPPGIPPLASPFPDGMEPAAEVVVLDMVVGVVLVLVMTVVDVVEVVDEPEEETDEPD